MLLLVSLEEDAEVRDRESEVVQVELDLRDWQLDKLLLLWLLIVATVLSSNAGDESEESEEDDDLRHIELLLA